MILLHRLAVLGLPLAAALILNFAAPAAAASPPSAASAPAAAEPVTRAEAPFTPRLVYADRILTEDTVWRGEVLVAGAVTVAPQATLSIEPGTVVRFQRQGGQPPLLVVEGRIVAAGSAEAPIVFSSAYAAPLAGDWQGLMLLGTEKKNLMEHCRIEGAQTGIDAMFSGITLRDVLSERSGIGMRFQDTLVTMDGGGVSGCDTGLRLTESEATLRSIAVAGNRVGISAKKSSVYLSDASLSGNRAAAFSGDGCRIKLVAGGAVGNGSGITVLASEGAVTGMKLAKNREYGISLTSSRIRVSGNQIAGNGDNGMLVFDAGSVAWENSIYENAGYDLYNAGTEEFRAPGNWWGTTPPKIYDNSGRGRVLYAPVLGARPQGPQ
jgi:hypothetical protein